MYEDKDGQFFQRGWAAGALPRAPDAESETVFCVAVEPANGDQARSCFEKNARGTRTNAMRSTSTQDPILK